MKRKEVLLCIVLLIFSTVKITVYDIWNSDKTLNATKINYNETNSNIKNNPNSYWSTTNAPVFYGTTKITIKRGLIEEFDVNDSRFRIFAKDFEDGDLTPSISRAGEVNVNEVGTYEITYTVSDSNKNMTTLTVPVIITDDESVKIDVERTLYTLPSLYAVNLTGITKCDDSQILGIYIPRDKEIKARVISSDMDITLGFLGTNESNTKLHNNGEWATIKGVSDAVPLFYSNVMEKGADINKTFKIELEYDETIPSLNYYHQKDDESEFINTWRNNQNAFSIIENEVLTAIVPYSDIDKLNKQDFKSLDEFLEYYKKVVYKMDENVGLELNPINITDQNVRTKLLMKTNTFKVDEGLNTIMQAYQGDLSKDTMKIDEVSDKVLNHYLDMDENIYTPGENTLGNLAEIEESENAKRLSLEAFTELESKTKLYVLINLFDSIDGEKTYSNIYKWYRKNISEGTITNKENTEDVYARAISDIYKINILPYFEAWKINVSNTLYEEIMSKNLKTLTILKDNIKDETLNKIVKDEDILKYSLVSNDFYKKYKITGNLTIDIKIDDFDSIKGKALNIKDDGGTIKRVKIENKKIEIKEIPVGSYKIEMPFLISYEQENLNVIIREDENDAYQYTYKDLEHPNLNEDYIVEILGENNILGCKLTLTENYTKAQIEFGNGNFEQYKTAKLRILSKDGGLIAEEFVDEEDNHFNFNKTPYTIDLKIGDIIEITHPIKDLVIFTSSITGNKIEEYSLNAATTRYTVVDNGIIKENMDEEAHQNILYNSFKQTATEFIEAYKNKVTTEELNNKTINFKEKSQVVYYYNKLKKEDRTSYDELITNIKRGGTPVITYTGNTEYEINSKVDLYSLITAKDQEDGNIGINKETTTIESPIDFTKSGEYKIVYKVRDLDNNTGIYESTIKIVDNTPQKPIESNSQPNQGADNNIGKTNTELSPTNPNTNSTIVNNTNKKTNGITTTNQNTIEENDSITTNDTTIKDTDKIDEKDKTIVTKPKPKSKKIDTKSNSKMTFKWYYLIPITIIVVLLIIIFKMKREMTYTEDIIEF